MRRCRNLSESRMTSLTLPPGRPLLGPWLILLFLFDQLLLLGILAGATAHFLVAIEVDGTVNQHLLYLGVVRKRKLVVDDDIGVLAHVDRSYAIVDTELLGGVQR